MNEDDLFRLRHMLDAAREAILLAQGSTRKTLDSDRKLVLALIADLSIIGEAASRVTREFQAAQPQVPWAALVGMRNILVHAYFRVDLDVVWDAVAKDLPDLIPKLEALISTGG